MSRCDPRQSVQCLHNFHLSQVGSNTQGCNSLPGAACASSPAGQHILWELQCSPKTWGALLVLENGAEGVPVEGESHQARPVWAQPSQHGQAPENLELQGGAELQTDLDLFVHPLNFLASLFGLLALLNGIPFLGTVWKSCLHSAQQQRQLWEGNLAEIAGSHHNWKALPFMPPFKCSSDARWP